MKKTLLVLSISLLAASSQAQQMTQFSQYLLNDYYINPAVAGTKDYSPLRLTYRAQWANFNGAPKTTGISFHSNYLDNMGIGGIIFNDKTGPLTQTGLEVTYAYHLEIENDIKVSLGLSAKATQYALDESQITLEETGDFAFNGLTNKTLIPDAGFGAYLYSKEYFIGLSVPQLFQARIRYDTDDEKLNKEVRHYYLTGGYDFEINNDFSVQPSFLLKTVFTAPTTFDINVKATYQEMVSVGVSYRFKDAIVVIVGVEKENFMLGYAYDVTTSMIRKYSAGSHEIVLGYNIPSRRKAMGKKRFSPRMG
ncbi:MAG: type IX secretion system membrane protein PorP/SprF [Flavobacteriales bacterium]|nr:type IX secretion system membrane protein PorP/SprF [Flavobacteriales bacterium]